MNHNFIPYPEALALKQLGFDEECFGYYEDGTFIFWYGSIQEPEFLLNCTAPLYSQAFKFFRDNYKLAGHAELVNISHLGEHHEFKIINFSDYVDEDTTLVGTGYSSHEEAELKGIQKLIELCR